MSGYTVKQMGDKFAVYSNALVNPATNENFADGKKPNQLRGKDRARTVKPSTTGSQPHPFKGKLVGNS
jgi:hypothetical protein